MSQNKKNILMRIFLSLHLCLCAGILVAQDIPWATSAEEVGMSSDRLERINDAMQRHIAAGLFKVLSQLLPVGASWCTSKRMGL